MFNFVIEPVDLPAWALWHPQSYSIIAGRECTLPLFCLKKEIQRINGDSYSSDSKLSQPSIWFFSARLSSPLRPLKRRFNFSDGMLEVKGLRHKT